MQREDESGWAVGVRDEIFLNALNQSGRSIGPTTSQLFCRRTLNNPSCDKFRDVIVTLFDNKHSVRKSDVKTAITTQLSENISDVIYGKIMREIARSDRGVWSLKDGRA